MPGTIAIIPTSLTDLRHAVIEKIAEPPSLAAMQAGVQGYLTIVPLFTSCRPLLRSAARCVAFCNEDGLALGLPLNPLATNLWHGIAPQMAHDRLRGPVLILSGDPAFMNDL